MTAGSFDELADYLTDGYWNLSGRTARWFEDPNVTVNITDLLPADQDFARQALQLWEDVSGLTFTYVSGIADIRFTDDNEGAFSFSKPDDGGPLELSVVNIGQGWAEGVGASLYSYRFATFIHEIGHAIGLGHQGPYNGSGEYPGDAAFSNDSWQASVMSYFHQVENTSINASFAYYLTPQIVDIIAIQNLYGAGTVREGDTIYGVGNTTGRDSYGVGFTYHPTITIYDSGGIDTLNYSDTFYNQAIDLTPEWTSSIYGEVNNLIIARDVIIENATTGSGHDWISGNDADNTLIGNAGHDTLLGGKGRDILHGGDGNDLLEGGSYQDTLFGGNDDDMLVGGSGRDTLIGGAGNDTYVLEHGVDIVIDPSGMDTFTTTISRSLARYEFVENLELNGSDPINGSGNALDNVVLGNAANNKLIGARGDDTIKGGLGVDLLIGGAGSDTFVFTDPAESGINGKRDVITDFGNNGLDRIDLSELSPGELTFRGTALFNGDDQVRVKTSGDDIFIDINLFGSRTPEMQIRLLDTDISELSAVDFIL